MNMQYRSNGDWRNDNTIVHHARGADLRMLRLTPHCAYTSGRGIAMASVARRGLAGLALHRRQSWVGRRRPGASNMSAPAGGQQSSADQHHRFLKYLDLMMRLLPLLSTPRQSIAHGESDHLCYIVTHNTCTMRPERERNVRPTTRKPPLGEVATRTLQTSTRAGAWQTREPPPTTHLQAKASV